MQLAGRRDLYWPQGSKQDDDAGQCTDTQLEQNVFNALTGTFSGPGARFGGSRAAFCQAG